MKGVGWWVLFMTLSWTALAQPRPREILREDLKEDPEFFWFQPAWEDYVVNDSLIDLLRPQVAEYQWLIFMGSWCSDSHQWIPPLFRIFSELNLPDSSYRILALDEAKQDGGLGMVDSFQVQWIPTIILLREGEERGRIVETVAGSLEAALLDRIQIDQKSRTNRNGRKESRR